MKQIDPKAAFVAAQLYNDVAGQLVRGGWWAADDEEHDEHALTSGSLWRHKKTPGAFTIGTALRRQHTWDLTTILPHVVDDAVQALSERVPDTDPSKWDKMRNVVTAAVDWYESYRYLPNLEFFQRNDSPLCDALEDYTGVTDNSIIERANKEIEPVGFFGRIRVEGLDLPTDFTIDTDGVVHHHPKATGPSSAVIDLLDENTALKQAMKECIRAMKTYAEWHGPTCEHHRDECPEECPRRQVDDPVHASFRVAEALLSKRFPG